MNPKTSKKYKALAVDPQKQAPLLLPQLFSLQERHTAYAGY